MAKRSQVLEKKKREIAKIRRPKSVEEALDILESMNATSVEDMAAAMELLKEEEIKMAKRRKSTGKRKKRTVAKRVVRKAPVMKTTPAQARAGMKLYHKRKPSAFNKCIGREMSGTKRGKTITKEFQKKFVKSAVACGANLTPSKKKKWGIK